MRLVTDIPCKALRQLAESVQGVQIRGVTVAGNRLAVKLDTPGYKSSQVEQE
jgi:hypothetical protein